MGTSHLYRILTCSEEAEITTFADFFQIGIFLRMFSKIIIWQGWKSKEAAISLANPH
jgi:hypothetical protein